MEKQTTKKIEITLDNANDAGEKLVEIYRLQQYDLAEKIAKQILEKHPTHTIARNIYLLSQLKHGKTISSENLPSQDEALILIELQTELIRHWIREHYSSNEQFDFLNKAEAILGDINYHYAQIYRNAEQREETACLLKKSVSISPKLQTYLSLISTLTYLRRYAEGIEWGEKALASFPNSNELLSRILYIYQRVCDWGHFDKLIKQVITLSQKNLSSGKGYCIDPFFAATSIADPQFNFHVARYHAILTKQHAEQSGPIYQHNPNQRKTNSRLKVGYLSGGFKDHPTGRMISHMFQFHDHEKFEIIAYSLSPDTSTHYTKTIQKSCEFKIVASLPSKELAKKINEDNIDILIDLDGYLAGGRMDLLAFHPAPIQIEYLGYPGTTGADYMDYIVADEIIIPKDHQAFFSEKVIYMPKCYQVNDSELKTSDKTFTRSDFNIPEKAFVFACFNVPYKIDQKTFDCWMTILKKVPNSVLWLLDWDPLITENLRDYAKKNGIDSGRLIFSEALEKSEHLKRHELVDVFLDSFICNAHSTASDALWAHVPVITLQGTHFASRVCSSLLNYVGTPELIARTHEEYIDTAVNLANNSKQLTKIKKHLKKQVPKTLFNTQLFVKNLEAAYQKVWKRFLKGDKPERLSL